MGVIATFSYEAWNARYPEFNVSQVQAQAFWLEATIHHRNDGGGPVNDIAMQAMLLNMLTSHIAMLAVGTAAQPASGLVGRISSANQGSVSVSTELAGLPGNAAYYTQTPYGLAWWNATAVFRTAHYRPGFGRRFGPGAWRQ